MSVNLIRASLQICHPAEICVTTLHYIAAEIYDDSTEMCVRLLSGGQWLHYYTEVPDGCIICVSDFYLVPSARLLPVLAARKWSSDSLLRWTVQ